MLSTTVTVRSPGLTVSLVSTATLLCAETVITTQSPEVSEPEYRDSVTLPATAAGTVITQRVTGPPTAPSLNVPRATLPAAAVSFSSAGITVRVPWAGGDEDDADGGAGAGGGRRRGRAGALRGTRGRPYRGSVCRHRRCGRTRLRPWLMGRR